MKNLFKRVGVLACLAILFLFVSQLFAPWKYNPFTRKLDWYSNELSALIIDVDKDWQTKSITNLAILALVTDVAPIASPADVFQMYSADIGGVAGKAGAHFRDEEGNIISLGSGGLISTGTARTLNALWMDAQSIRAPQTNPAELISHGTLETPAFQFADAIEANQESVTFNMRVPNRMDRTTASTISTGWSADGSSPGNCRWQLEYLWTAPGEDTGAGAQETLAVTGTAVVVADGMVLTTFVGIDLLSATDICIHCRITRLSADGLDTISDTVELHGVCLGWTSNKLGLPT